MEGSSLGSQNLKEQEFNLKEWHLRARITRENTSSRRYSASYIRSFREDSMTSFRSNFIISSTASSPGCNLKDEIDPSTYSFTTALKALQAKSGYVWECLSPEGFSLNSKWDEAERYICNPLSGEVPMECLSSKTLSGRSFRSYMASRVTMSAPLVYSIQPRKTSSTFIINNKLSPPIPKEQLVIPSNLGQEEKKVEVSKTRDVGTQSSSVATEENSSSPSPTSTPSIKDRKIICFLDTEDGDTQNSSSTTNFNHVQEVEVKGTREGGETKITKERGQRIKNKKTRQLCFCKQSIGCLQLSSWSCMWMNKRRHRDLQTSIN